MSIMERYTKDQKKRLVRRSQNIFAASFAIKLSTLSDLQCCRLFRFCCEYMLRFIPVLTWPKNKRKPTKTEYSVTLFLATYLVLRRLAMADRWYDMESLFRKSAAQLSENFCDAVHIFMKKRAGLLTTSIPRSYIVRWAEWFAPAAAGKSGSMGNCVAFIHGIVIGTSRPGGNDMLQQVAYNVHKQKYALKYQVVTTPDGICIHLHRLEVGRRHDMFLCIIRNGRNVAVYFTYQLLTIRWFGRLGLKLASISSCAIWRSKLGQSPHSIQHGHVRGLHIIGMVFYGSQTFLRTH